MEKSTKSVITIEDLNKYAHEYVGNLSRHESILGHRYVISTGDRNKDNLQKMGFMQYLEKRLDADNPIT